MKEFVDGNLHVRAISFRWRERPKKCEILIRIFLIELNLFADRVESLAMLAHGCHGGD